MAFFSIRPKAGGYLISDNNIDNATFVPDQEALQQLYSSIGEILGIENPPTPASTETPPEMISSGDAITYASEQGYNLGITTLNSACERGSIPGATQGNANERYARWQIPRHEFMLWFSTWKTKADRKKK